MTLTVTRPDRIGNPAALKALLREYYETILPRLAAVGGPSLSADSLLEGFDEGLAAYLPPEGVTVLAHDDRQRLVGCGFLRRIGEGRGELKRLYVMPEAQGRGLGRRLVQERIDAGRAMGLTRLFTDTVRGNMPMLSLYASLGFREIPRYEGNANDPALAPFLVYLELDLADQ
ncbi:GNAT family N-acetyltransferase [Histidinibacterium lentulum]|uniref:GNAT family N-acetyltransferase n=1 Tax=Histidinibacterium lentulum TaxID=2480588 RepID=A0A3N2QWH0_9RHOB|nr:GNAT family N-acetyltransferase [Histidinibacterium lentulum]ROT99479.1 GNAT family N-acetyltransferase [Histidinibacterium lentulum]